MGGSSCTCTRTWPLGAASCACPTLALISRTCNIVLQYNYNVIEHGKCTRSTCATIQLRHSRVDSVWFLCGSLNEAAYFRGFFSRGYLRTIGWMLCVRIFRGGCRGRVAQRLTVSAKKKKKRHAVSDINVHCHIELDTKPRLIFS